MSGGSFSYLYNRDTEELFQYTWIHELERMESELIIMGHIDIAKDFRRLIVYILSARNRVDVLATNLNDIMHDIEWYYSADIDKETLDETIEKYRKMENQ